MDREGGSQNVHVGSQGGRGVKKTQKIVHMVCRWPLLGVHGCSRMCTCRWVLAGEWAGMCRCGHVGVGVGGCMQVGAGVHRCARECAGMCVCIYMHESARECAGGWICTGVHMGV